jgi:exosortase
MSTARTQELVAKDQVVPLALLGALLIGLIYTYLNSLQVAAAGWQSPQYSHGYLVPLFTAVLLWLRWEKVQRPTAAAAWCGVALLAASLGLRMFSAYVRVLTFDMYTFVPALLGITLLVGGWSMLRWAGPPIAFLIFMFPLPVRVEESLLAPMQAIAAVASTFTLQTLGMEVVREGNQMWLYNLPLGVEEACSGLRMVTIFLALSVAVTMVAQRSWWENIIIIASAIPIALAVNVIRIVVTGILYLTTSKELGDLVFHDLAGWVMMPMALGFLFLELQLLSALVVDESQQTPVAMGFGPRQPAP